MYRANTREMSRIDSISNSPLHAMFSETVDGLTTVRALQLQQSDTAEMIRRMDTNNRASYYWGFARRWFQLRISCVRSVLRAVHKVALRHRLPHT